MRRRDSYLVVALVALVALMVAACGEGDDAAWNTTASASLSSTAEKASTAASTPITGSLTIDSSWFWQLQGSPEPPYVHDVYDLDLFETEPETVAALHDAGSTLICYFSAGSYEEWRPDADEFSPGDTGATLDGFEDERWLDIRSAGVRQVMTGRLDRALALGCDGVEPDNVTGFSNDSGFDLGPDDQLDFNRFLADAAHERGLLIGLKNDLDQIAELVDDFDFAVNEQCHEFDECELNQPFLDAGKPVFNAEYADRFVEDPESVCGRARTLGLRTLILPVDLDGSFHTSCDELRP